VAGVIKEKNLDYDCSLVVIAVTYKILVTCTQSIRIDVSVLTCLIVVLTKVSFDLFCITKTKVFMNIITTKYPTFTKKISYMILSHDKLHSSTSTTYASPPIIVLVGNMPYTCLQRLKQSIKVFL
ncbi:hypothetical protein H312_02563, partial [Anncaliia algerae PRA339]